jgi:hypothetical protein
MSYIRRLYNIPKVKIHSNRYFNIIPVSNNMLNFNEDDYLTIMSHLQSINWFEDNAIIGQNKSIKDTYDIKYEDDYYKNYSHMQYLTSIYDEIL